MQKIKFTKEKIGWIFYDFSNQSFVTIIVTLLFSIYFKDIIVGQEEVGTALWGRAISISMILVACIAPIMGAIADYTQTRKKLLIIFSYITIILTMMLYFVNKGDVFLGMLFFIIANFGYSMGTVLYNSFLPDIAEKQEIGRLSGLSWGLSYLGGLLSLFVIYPIIKLDLQEHLSYRYSFVIVGLMFAIFSLPTFLWLKERKKTREQQKNFIFGGFKRILETAKNVKKYKELIKFLFSFFLYTNAILVVVFFAAIYGSSRFGMTSMDMLKYFIIAQPSSFLGAAIFGHVLERIGAKNSINITLIIWFLVIIGAYFCSTINQFYLVGVGAGFAMGSSQANSRSLLALFTPINKTTEFFGFYSVISCAASILGPLIYGEIARITNDQRNSILSILIFFVLGFIFLQFVDEKKGQEAARS
ncbi:MAG: MFS transporter [Candidatus Cloacimonetes bacterium]|nr:MFS transporter [Candidatus Cloacimonadota bacterium]